MSEKTGGAKHQFQLETLERKARSVTAPGNNEQLKRKIMKVDFRTGLTLVAVVIFLSAMRCAGRQEHAEDVVLRMSQEQYDEINARLGGCNDVVKIAEYYEREN